MKIGLLTFHCAQNFGAVLQCYATQEFLKNKGYDVEVIDYRPDYLLRPYRLFNVQRLACGNPIKSGINLVKELIQFPRRCYRQWAYRKFANKYLTLSDTVTKESIPPYYDTYLVGSDQIWNPRLTKGFDDAYFCRFKFPKDNKRYVAYAASMEVKELSAEDKQYYQEVLSRFDAVSVREDELARLLQPLTSQPVTQVLDPTLMADPQIWDAFSTRSSFSKKKYVVIYQGRSNKASERIAKDIAKQVGGEVYILSTWFSLSRGETHMNISPEQFVDIIRNAACVITTSFHGTAFSIIFNRPFYTIRMNDGADTRSQSLLASLNLQDRMIGTDASPLFSAIDYSEANVKLEQLRSRSQQFLLDALQGTEGNFLKSDC